MISRIHLRHFLRGLLYISFAVGATGACAQGKADIAASRHPVSERLMAERLARLGEQTQDALALIVAARIKQQTGERTTKRDFRSRDAQDAIPAAQRSDTSLAALIARAKTLAKGRADLIALANEVESSRGRGRPEGPYVATTVIRGGVTSVLEMRFEGGTLAVIGISGDGATDLDLYVTDEDGKRVCTAEGDSDDEICRFTPRVTATYRIEVRNRGKIANQFLFVSN